MKRALLFPVFALALMASASTATPDAQAKTGNEVRVVELNDQLLGPDDILGPHELGIVGGHFTAPLPDAQKRTLYEIGTHRIVGGH